MNPGFTRSRLSLSLPGRLIIQQVVEFEKERARQGSTLDVVGVEEIARHPGRVVDEEKSSAQGRQQSQPNVVADLLCDVVVLAEGLQEALGRD